MNIELDSQIRTLFEGIDESQRPVSLDEIQTGQVQTRPAEGTPSRMWSLLLVSVAVLLTGLAVVFGPQRSRDDLVLVTQSQGADAAASPNADSEGEIGRASCRERV